MAYYEGEIGGFGGGYNNGFGTGWEGIIGLALVASLFGGGGHFNASGCRIYSTLSETINKLLTVAERFLKDYDA